MGKAQIQLPPEPRRVVDAPLASVGPTEGGAETEAEVGLDHPVLIGGDGVHLHLRGLGVDVAHGHPGPDLEAEESVVGIPVLGRAAFHGASHRPHGRRVGGGGEEPSIEIRGVGCRHLGDGRGAGLGRWRGNGQRVWSGYGDRRGRHSLGRLPQHQPQRRRLTHDLIGPVLGHAQAHTESGLRPELQGADRAHRGGQTEARERRRLDAHQDVVSLLGGGVRGGRTAEDETHRKIVAGAFVDDGHDVVGPRHGRLRLR